MARPEPLPQGQLNPAARPVDAFLAPVNRSIAEPARPSEMGQVQGVSVIQDGGRPNVQGYNSAAQLAEALGPFTRELTKAAQNIGLEYASWNIQKGEAEFMAAYRQAQLNVDQQGEVGEGQYAKASREVYAKDQKAGWGMWLANPYRQMGADRARSRLAGQEIEYRMSGIENQITGEDYESADQGFTKLQSLRGGLIAQITKQWGVDENTPGFQKYAAPAIEKASERAASKLIEDRQKYFDETKPRQLTQLLRNEIFVMRTKGTFEYQGNTYGPNTKPEIYWLAFGNRLNDMARDFLSKAGPGGMASKWSREAYEGLLADANFRDDNELRRMIGTIKSSEPLRGADGKPVVDMNGQPVYLTWDQLYRQDNIDSQIKYEQAGYASREARSKDISSRAAAEMDLASEGAAIGPERAQRGLDALNRFTQQEEQRLGRPLTAVERLAIKKEWAQATNLNSEILSQSADPNVEANYLGELEQKYGTAFNAANERKRVVALAAELAQSDPKRAQQFQAAALNQIEQKEKEVQDFSGYTSARDKVINSNIEARLRRNYEYLQGAADPKADREESERRQRGAYTSHVNTRIREKEAQLSRKLNDSEVRSVTQQAIDEYGKNDKDALQYLFPGSLAYPKSPSVDPYRTIKPVNLGPDGKPKPVQPTGPDGKPITLYSTSQLDDIPERAVVLRQYRTLPVLGVESVRNLILDGIEGKPWPVKFEKAWRDAGAPNAYDFLMKQLEKYPNYKPDWTPQELTKFRKQQLSSAGTENAGRTYASLAPQMPSLASLATWTLDAVLGGGPAVAATRGGGGEFPFTDSPGGDLGRFRKAIIGKESGGRYNAVNPDSGALGIGQVMPDNVGPWTQKYLGRRLTPQQFLASPQAQDAVINGRFKDMLADQKAAGYKGEMAIRRAAAVWYSGRASKWNDTTPQYSKGRRYPSIAQYTQAIWDSYRRAN